jgi:predicted Zn-dependent protease
VLACLALIFVWYRAGADIAADASVGTDVPLAREAFIKGKYLWRKGTTAELEQALPYFEEAVRIDPNFAAAYAAAGDTWQILANRGARTPHEAFPRARTAAERALILQPNLADAKMVLGTVMFRYDWDWKGAEQNLSEAVHLDPKLAAARHDYAWFLIAMRRFDEGVAEMRRAHELDPLSLRANVDIGWALLRAGRTDEAITHLRRILELEPEFVGVQHCLEVAYIAKGMYAEAFDFARRAVLRTGVTLDQIPDAGASDPKLAFEAIWRWLLTRSTKPYALASWHAMLGNRDKAFEFLERAFDARDPMMVEVQADSAFQSLRNDPRFADLLSRIGLP